MFNGLKGGDTLQQQVEAGGGPLTVGIAMPMPITIGEPLEWSSKSPTHSTPYGTEENYKQRLK